MCNFAKHYRKYFHSQITHDNATKTTYAVNTTETYSVPPDIHAFSWPPQSSQRKDKLCERVQVLSDCSHTGIRVYTALFTSDSFKYDDSCPVR